MRAAVHPVRDGRTLFLTDYGQGLSVGTRDTYRKFLENEPEYNTNPMIQKKRKLLREWVAFLDRCEAEAVAVDPDLKDPVKVGEMVFRHRNGEESYRRAVAAAPKNGGLLPWSKVERLVLTERAIVESLEVWRKKKLPA